MLTIVVACYGQPKMLEVWWQTIRSYDEELRRMLKFIIVDDCGTPPAEIPDDIRWMVSIMLLRVTENIPWNQMGARNLGMHHARGWCMMIDPDMVFPRDMMWKAVGEARRLDRGTAMRYALKHHNDPKRELDISSPNTYIIHRDDFFAAGGYDEEYRGHKGWSDVQMLDVLRSHYRVTQTLSVHADFYGTDAVPDAAVHSLDRSTAHNRKLRIAKQALAKKLGGWVKWAKKAKGPILNFKWMQVWPEVGSTPSSSAPIG